MRPTPTRTATAARRCTRRRCTSTCPSCCTRGATSSTRCGTTCWWPAWTARARPSWPRPTCAAPRTRRPRSPQTSTPPWPSPIMRRHAESDEQAAALSRDDAVKIIRECMKVLYYRDARSLDTYSLAVVTKDGVEISTDEKLEDQSWAFADRIKGYGTQVV